MRLRSFTAPNMAEAIRKVREAFGDDAIIISSQYRGPGLGVQVTAAFERDPLAAADDGDAQAAAAPVPRQALGRPLPGRPALDRISVDQAIRPDADPVAGAPDGADDPENPFAAPAADLAGIEDPLAFGTALDAAIDHAVRRKDKTGPAGQGSTPPPAGATGRKRAAAGSAPGMAAEKVAEKKAAATRPRQPDRLQMLAAAEELARTLAWHGVPVRLNERLTLAAAAVGLDDREDALARALAQAFRFVPVPATPERPIVLVGPHGSGKTLACAKLAARAVIAGIRITVISADTARAGAIAQLSTFIDLLRQPMVTVESPQEMARAVERARGSGPVFIDTPGINPFLPAETALLKEQVDAAAGDPVAVLAAGGDPAEAVELADIFSGIGARQLVATRLDASRRYGAILAAAEDSRLRLANLSLTPYVADGLQPATAGLLARLLLKDPEGSGSAPVATGPAEPGASA